MKRLFTIALILLTFNSYATFDTPVIRIVVRNLRISGSTPVVPGIITGNYKFTMPFSGIASGGIYTSSGKLVETLFSGEYITAGDHVKNTSTILGANHIEIVANQVNYKWEGVIGNTSTNYQIHGYDNINGMAISGSNIYAAIGVNEAAGTKIKIPTTNTKTKSYILPSGQGTSQETRHVTTDGTNVYWAEKDTHGTEYFIHRTSVSADAQVSFSSGVAFTPTVSIAYGSVIGKSGSEIKGLAVNDNFIFATRATDTLQVFTKSSGALAQTISITTPTKLFANNDTLWLITNNTVKKYTVNSDGTLAASSLTLSGITTPGAVAVHNSTVSVVDLGTQQVKHFSKVGNLLSTLGTSGGYATSSVVTNTKFYMERPYIAYESDASYWIADDGNFRNLHFNSSNTYIDQIAYIPVNYIIAVDRSNPTRVFAQHLEYTVGYDTITNWTLSNNWKYNLPPGNNNRNTFEFVETLSNGKTYSVVRDGNAFNEIVELVPNGNLRYTGKTFHPTDKQLSSNGDIVKQDFGNATTKWFKEALTGFTSSNPDYAASVEVNSTGVLAATDARYRGNGSEYKAREITDKGYYISFDGSLSTGYHVGAYKNGESIWQAAPSTHTEYTGPFPSKGEFDIGNGVNQYAGSNAMAIGSNVFWGYHGEFWKGGQVNIWNHLTEDGLFVGQFGTSEGSYKESFPAMAGNAFNTRAVQVGSNYYLYHNDESYQSGIHRFRISNSSSITKLTTSTTALPVDLNDTINLMTGLPFNSTLANNTASWTRSPTSNNSFVTVKTSVKTYNKLNGDDVQAIFQNGNGTSTVTRSLPVVSTLSNWSIKGGISYENGNVSFTGGNEGMLQLQVRDVDNKIIASLIYATNFGADPQHIYFNGHSLAQSASSSDVDNSAFENTYTKKISPFTISFSGSTLSVNYAGFTYSTNTASDVTSNKQRPASIVISNVDNTVVGNTRAMDLSNLKFTQTVAL